jgi:shikimate kinase/3-dehydroquinate synthase
VSDRATVSPSTRSVVVVGYMGAGKTTAAHAFAAAGGIPAIDVDEEIVRRSGRSIPEIFAAEGEAAFRALEQRLTLELLSAGGPRVISLGGGALGSATIREALGSHLVVWIDIDADTAWRRCAGTGRPLARDRTSFAALHAEREPVYAAAADIVIPHRRASDVAAVLACEQGRPAGVRMLWATSASGDYPAYVGPGLLASVPGPTDGPPSAASPPTEAFWPATVPGRRYVVTDYNAGRLYADRLPSLDGRVTIMPGEQSKTIAHAEIVWSELARAAMTRADVVVALGGGVVGDLAGFCAATYQRGVRFVQVPTTLVAQVDSAYGGKTGVDLAEAKNYVGAYHQPQAVIADTDALATLPAEELAAGYAEVVKTALLAGGWLWERVRSGAPATDPEVVTACAQTKLRVVAADERDTGLRQTLNLGHTVGHAIETVTGYASYRHGEAVGLGLLAALRLSGADALRAEVAELLAAGGLPTELRGVDPDAVVMATARDKKRVGEGPVPFVLLAEPGDPRPGSAVAPRELISAVRELATD